MSDHIDHAAEARTLVNHTTPHIDGVGRSVDALTHATLALVEQQRIANLIAANPWAFQDGREQADVRAEIRKGLGL